jgi:serine protease Do
MQNIDGEPEIEIYNEDFANHNITTALIESQVTGQIPEPRRPAYLAWVAVALVVVMLVGSVAAIQVLYKRTSNKIPELPTSRAVSTSEAPSPVELSRSFREIAKVVKPALVYIDVSERVGGNSRLSESFGLPGNPRRQPSAGSGFIVTTDGYILTNNHVVENAERIEVTLADNRRFRATVKGTDPNTDLAVIKIDASGLPIAILGNSDEVQQGDWVLALGSPFGLQQTLTAGIVSATGRELAGSQFSRFIQTDASINPGNSGGPLVNMSGEVIGINTMIFSPEPRSGSVGIGFAIASTTARAVFPQLVRDGRVSRGYLGVRIEELDEPRARALGLEPRAGVFVERIEPDTPAAKAGLQNGDVIIALDGQQVKMPRELTNVVAGMAVGASVRVDFIRDHKQQSVSIELAERPNNFQARTLPMDPEPDSPSYSVSLGVIAQTVTAEMAERMKLKIASGAFVVTIQPGSPASGADIRHGDVIHQVGPTLINNIQDLDNAVKALKSGERVVIIIERKGERVFVTVNLD